MFNCAICSMKSIFLIVSSTQSPDNVFWACNYVSLSLAVFAAPAFFFVHVTKSTIYSGFYLGFFEISIKID